MEKYQSIFKEKQKSLKGIYIDIEEYQFKKLIYDLPAGKPTMNVRELINTIIYTSAKVSIYNNGVYDSAFTIKKTKVEEESAIMDLVWKRCFHFNIVPDPPKKGGFYSYINKLKNYNVDITTTHVKNIKDLLS